MIEIILGSIIIALIVDRFYVTRKYALQVDEFMRALMAKNLTEFEANEIMRKKEPTAPVKPPEYIPLEQADESVFSKHLKQIANGDQLISEI